MDEAAELAVALGEAQNAQNMAEGSLVSAKNEIARLVEENRQLVDRVTNLEIANINMDTLLQEFRVQYKPSPAAVDRG